jgi:hypothetical protein
VALSVGVTPPHQSTNRSRAKLRDQGPSIVTCHSLGIGHRYRDAKIATGEPIFAPKSHKGAPSGHALTLFGWGTLTGHVEIVEGGVGSACP